MCVMVRVLFTFWSRKTIECSVMCVEKAFFFEMPATAFLMVMMKMGKICKKVSGRKGYFKNNIDTPKYKDFVRGEYETVLEMEISVLRTLIQMRKMYILNSNGN